MRNATRRLREEHRNLGLLLDVLERQLDALYRGDSPDFDLMAEILHYLTEYPDRYHHPYEDLVYDRLAYRVPGDQALVEALHEQHRELAREGRRALTLVEGLLNGVMVARGEICSVGQGYVNAYREHMEHEEEAILARAEARLTPGDWLQIDTLFHWRPDPLFGPEVGAEYQALHDRIRIETRNRQRSETGQEYCGACASS